MSTITPPRTESVDVSTLLAELDASRQTPMAFARSRGLAPWRVYNALNRRKAIARRAGRLKAGTVRETCRPLSAWISRPLTARAG